MLTLVHNSLSKEAVEGGSIKTCSGKTLAQSVQTTLLEKLQDLVDSGYEKKMRQLFPIDR